MKDLIYYIEIRINIFKKRGVPEEQVVIAELNGVLDEIKQMFDEENNRGDRFMSCSQCKREFEWNGKDKGELIRVRGSGMWCKKCFELLREVKYMSTGFERGVLVGCCLSLLVVYIIHALVIFGVIFN